jgi:hypothetical protein
MTTLEASLKLFNWFSKKDYFNYPKDLNKLLVNVIVFKKINLNNKHYNLKKIFMIKKRIFLF